MKNREWILETLDHHETAAVPYNFMLSPMALEKVQMHYGAKDIQQRLNMPIRMSGTVSIKPLYASPEIFGETARDEFGVIWSTNAIDRGSPIGPCLNEPSLSNYKFPDPSEAYRFEGLDKWCKANEGSFKVLWVGDLWERATFMRGMENILIDLVADPKFVEELLRNLTDRVLRTTEILCDRFSFDAIGLSDDYGTQRSMLMSPTTWRVLIKPLLSEIYSFAKSRNRRIFHHCCGNIYPIIGDMIDIGLDILHPIQPEAMDIYELKREFGHDITFCGGLRTQDLLPWGTPEEIRTEVRKLKQEMGKGGGYILEPGITIQADIPLENIVACIDEAMA